MTVVHGKNTKVYANGYDLTSFFRAAGRSNDIDLADATTFGNDFMVYVPGLAEAKATLEGLLDDTAGVTSADHVLASAFGSSGQLMLLFEGDGFGKPAVCMSQVQSSYELDTSVGDLVQLSAEFQSETDVDRADVLLPLGEVTVTGNGSALDNLVSSALGLVAYLQVTALDAGTLDVKVQHSVDASAWVDLVSFTQIAGGASVHEHERVTVASGTTIDRHLRVLYTLAGGATAATLVAAVRRK